MPEQAARHYLRLVFSLPRRNQKTEEENLSWNSLRETSSCACKYSVPFASAQLFHPSHIFFYCSPFCFVFPFSRWKSLPLDLPRERLLIRLVKEEISEGRRASLGIRNRKSSSTFLPFWCASRASHATLNLVYSVKTVEIFLSYRLFFSSLLLSDNYFRRFGIVCTMLQSYAPNPISAPEISLVVPIRENVIRVKFDRQSKIKKQLSECSLIVIRVSIRVVRRQSLAQARQKERTRCITYISPIYACKWTKIFREANFAKDQSIGVL